MIVYSTGLDANPETLIARAKHSLMFGGYTAEESELDRMYDDVFARLGDDGERSPYPFHEVITDLVGLGFDVRDWPGANVKSILPFDPDTRATVKLVFQSRLSPGKATVKVAGSTVRAFVTDMEQSGLWLLVSAETAERGTS